MKYKLYKELKEARFPQDTQWKIDEVNCKYLQYEKINCDNWACPTLSELIEACGDKFFGVIREEEGKWEATSEMAVCCYAGDTKYSGKGKTPEEAVAYLYLALNRDIIK